MSLIKPPVLPPWADSGDKVQPSNAELQVGWPVSSIPPARQRFNWILNYLANAARYFSRRGISDYDASETYMIGDRVIGDDGKTYRSLIDTNLAQTPSTSPTKWELWALTQTQGDVRVRDGLSTIAASAGTADAITLTLTPTQTAFAPGPTWWRATATNATTTPTVKRDGLAAKTLVKGNNLVLAAGDIPGAGAWMCSQYDATLDKEVLLNPASGVTTKGVQRITANGSFTVPAGVSTVYVSGCAGGGGGGGTPNGTSASASGAGGGGAGQSIIRQSYSVTPGQVVAVTIGGAGTGGATGANNGTAGGDTIIGALVTLTGGSPGTAGINISSPFGGSGGAGYPNGGYGDDGPVGSAGGQGGSSPFGGGGSRVRGGSTAGFSGVAAFGYGGGGGGASGYYLPGAGSGAAGAAGAAGLVIFEW